MLKFSKKFLFVIVLTFVAGSAFAAGDAAAAPLLSDNWAKYVGAGLAMSAGIGAGIGIGLSTSGAIQGMARNPSMFGKLRTIFFIGAALAEAVAIYGLVVVILLLFVV